MEYRDLKFPVNRKHSMIWMLLLTVSTVMFTMIIASITNPLWVQLISLLKSDYEYSVKISRENIQDSYYMPTFSITFADLNSNYTLNADVLMQTEKCEYSRSLVAWEVSQPLGNRNIAISRNLANKERLEIGDKLHSSHRVYDTQVEYTIVEIISAVEWVSSESSTNSGLIIMGYDHDYKNNLTFESLLFTTEKITDIAHLNPLNIKYRSDEIHGVLKKIIAPITIMTLLTSSFFIYCAYRFRQKHKYYFQRLKMLGYPNKPLISKWRCAFALVNGIPILMAAIINGVLSCFLQWHLIVPLIVLCVQTVMFLITLQISNRYAERG